MPSQVVWDPSLGSHTTLSTTPRSSNISEQLESPRPKEHSLAPSQPC